MKFEELIDECVNNGYITVYPIEYGFVISVQHGKLHALIINTIKNENHNDLSMWYWSKYSITIFSCAKFNEYCNNRTKNKEKTILPDEIYEKSMPVYRSDAIEKFNTSNYNYIIKNGWIVNKQISKQKLQKEIEIDNFVKEIQNL